jgi:hypothetical protein
MSPVYASTTIRSPRPAGPERPAATRVERRCGCLYVVPAASGASSVSRIMPGAGMASSGRLRLCAAGCGGPAAAGAGPGRRSPPERRIVAGSTKGPRLSIRRQHRSTPPSTDHVDPSRRGPRLHVTRRVGLGRENRLALGAATGTPAASSKLRATGCDGAPHRHRRQACGHFVRYGLGFLQNHRQRTWPRNLAASWRAAVGNGGDEAAQPRRAT